MEDDHAQHIAGLFIGKELGGCAVERYINHGASGVVLQGMDGEDRVAIKVYAKHLINDASEIQAKTELERIQRQVALGAVDPPHPNIIKTRRSGQCERTGYHYLVMDFAEDKTLEEVLSDIPRPKIREIIRDIAKATLYLQESLGHVHRDIKPPNIAINLDTLKVTLLDLGLVRPVTGETMTDQAPRFVGTKRYAPPEFLNGTMTKDENGWNALSFYQLGAILYELIMQKPLFDGYTGETLKRATESEVPQIDASDIPADLVLLARNCLQKDAATRLSLVSWNSFLAEPDLNTAINEADRLRHALKRLPKTDSNAKYPAGAREQHAIDTAYKRLELAVDYHLRSLLSSDEDLYPRHTVTVTKTGVKSFVAKATLFYDTDGAVSVTIFLVSELLDPASALCTCKLISCAGEVEKIPPSSEATVLFNGSFVEGVFSQQLDTAVPAAIAKLINSQGGQHSPSDSLASE